MPRPGEGPRVRQHTERSTPTQGPSLGVRTMVFLGPTSALQHHRAVPARRFLDGGQREWLSCKCRFSSQRQARHHPCLEDRCFFPQLPSQSLGLSSAGERWDRLLHDTVSARFTIRLENSVQFPFLGVQGRKLLDSPASLAAAKLPTGFLTCLRT